jgi:hypothetical protein
LLSDDAMLAIAAVICVAEAKAGVAGAAVLAAEAEVCCVVAGRGCCCIDGLSRRLLQLDPPVLVSFGICIAACISAL